MFWKDSWYIFCLLWDRSSVAQAVLWRLASILLSQPPKCCSCKSKPSHPVPTLRCRYNNKWQITSLYYYENSVECLWGIQGLARGPQDTLCLWPIIPAPYHDSLLLSFSFLLRKYKCMSLRGSCPQGKARVPWLSIPFYQLPIPWPPNTPFPSAPCSSSSWPCSKQARVPVLSLYVCLFPICRILYFIHTRGALFSFGRD